MLAAFALPAFVWPTPGHAYTADQQQACTGDALRLCGSEVPDVDRITACMIQKKAQLSPGCRVFFRAGPESGEDADAATGKPMDLKPASTRKPVGAKSHKSKKPAKSDAT
jgi:hypothetical protein